MSSTNKTTHYELPQFVENDIFNPLVDDNDAYDKIDTALYNIANAEAGDAAEIVDIKGRLDTAEGKVATLEEQNGTDVLTTVAQTLSGAVNELKSGEDSLDGRLDVVEDDINNASTGLKAKVSALENQNGSEVLETTANTLSGAVNELVDVDEALKAYDEVLKTGISKGIKSVNGSIVLDAFYDNGYWLQSATAVNGKIVAYYNGSTNTGKLVCFDKENYSKLWEYSIEAYHGNTMFYRPVDNCLYICGCVPSDSTDLLDKVIVVDFSQPSIIKTVITTPIPVGNIGYDADNDVFYGSDRTANLYKFEGVFESVAETIPVDLGTIPNVNYTMLACIHKGIMYGFGYDRRCTFISGWNIASGELVYYAPIEPIFNGFRRLGEVENLFFDASTGLFILGSILRHSVCGSVSKHLTTFCEVGVYNAVPEIIKYAKSYIDGDASEVASRRTIAVCSETDDVQPWITTKLDFVKCILDAVTVGFVNKQYINIQISTQYNATNEIGSLYVGAFEGSINKHSSTTEVILHKIIATNNARIEFNYCRFVDKYLGSVDTEANVVIPRFSEFTFSNCVFNDYEDTSGLEGHLHIFVLQHAVAVITTSNTFGTKQKTGGNGEVKNTTTAWKTAFGIGGHVNSEVDTYVESDVTITVPAGRTYLCAILQGYTNAKPTGSAITPASSTSVNNPTFMYETPSGISCNATPTFILSPSSETTYKVWCKKNTAATNETVTLIYKDITW